MALDKRYVEKLMRDISIWGVREAVKRELVKRFMTKLVSLASFFSFAPIAAVAEFLIGHLVVEILDESVQFVRDEIHNYMVKSDFEEYKKVQKKKEEIEAKPDTTKEDLDALDDEIKHSIDNAIRVGRLR